MIKIRDDAHANKNPGGGYELFIDRLIPTTNNEGVSTTVKKRTGGLIYATLSGTLNGYVEEHLRSLASTGEEIDLKQVREEIANLKREITRTYNVIV